ncbi:substrate-binding domain-containing protein [Thalassobius sp. MITS945101]|uniref:substrate-binding domain-containing protein n=1 Tax=Thalassobius sp. MITS945101 TaxID=3096994 RepID=UPI00399AD2DD
MSLTESGLYLISQSRQVDIAIFAAPSRSPFIDYREITQMRFPLVVAPELLDRPAPDMNKEDLARHPQVVVKSTDEKSPDVGLLQQAPKWFVTDMSTKKVLVLAGLGWGRLPDHMMAADIARGALVDLEVMGDVTLPICLTKRAGFNLGVVGQRIRSHFRSRFGDDPVTKNPAVQGVYYGGKT